MKHGIKSVLITQSQLKNYSGSEMVTLELAEYFTEHDCEVTILSHFADNPILSDLRKANVDVILTNSNEAKSINISDFDLIWVHHSTFTAKILKDINKHKNKSPLVIFHHMSYVDPIEGIFFAKVENSIANVIAFNSHETRDEIIGEIGTVIDEKKVFVLDNPSPDAFKVDNLKKIKKLQSIAVVSNHPPSEVLEAVSLIKNNDSSLKVDIYGRVNGGKESRITPELISKYDIILTIGKTVQYSILSNRPVYCYDRFGGPGFINQSNFETAHHYNFSGRGFGKKTAETIASEILDRYGKSAEEFLAIHKKHSAYFSLNNQIENILQSASGNARSRVSSTDIYQVSKYIDMIQKTFPGYCRSVHFEDKIRHENHNLARKLKLANQAINRRDKEIAALSNSKMIRLSRYIKRYKGARSERGEL